MNTAIQYPHISLDASGQARIGNSRYKVLHLAGEHFHYGWSAEELLRQHPDLKPEEVYAALTYFYDHYDAMCEALRAAGQSAAALRNAALESGRLPSREVLLRRKKLEANGGRLMLRLYMDVHVPAPISESLRRRGIDVLTSQEDWHTHCTRRIAAAAGDGTRPSSRQPGSRSA
jgi:uncharacterized protein (DUF433 family)